MYVFIYLFARAKERWAGDHALFNSPNEQRSLDWGRRKPGAQHPFWDAPSALSTALSMALSAALSALAFGLPAAPLQGSWGR